MVEADPHRILERVPELAELVHVPRVKRAIERGDLHGLYRVLFLEKLFGTLPRQRELLTMLVARRRLFLTPLRRALTLRTINGVGATVYGGSDVDLQDGTYIKTWFLVLGFVPVFPLGQYLVHDAGPRQWSIIGKVPLAPLLWLWRSGFSLAAVGGIALALLSAFHASRYNGVYVLNALPIAVQVELAAQRVAIEPDAQVKLEVPAGAQPIVIRAHDGRTIEQGTVLVQPGVDVQGWNILGAAPLIYERVVYYKVEPKQPPSYAAPTLGCGKREFSYDPVNDVFMDPPKSVSMAKDAQRAFRWHAGVLPGGVRSCLAWLRRTQADASLQLAREVAVASDYQLEATSHALSLLAAGDDVQRALAFAREALAKHPDVLELHRTYQDLCELAGERAQVIAQYDARLASMPDDIDAAYLAARVKPTAQARPLVDALVVRAPHHPNVLVAHAVMHFNAGDYAGALASWHALETVDAARYANSLPQVAQTLVALGRADDALAALDRAAPPEEARAAVERALTYAQIAQLTGADPDKLALQLSLFESAGMRDWFHASYGRLLEQSELESLDPETRAGVVLVMASQRTPSVALALVPNVSRNALQALRPELWLLLYAEAVLEAAKTDGAAEKALRAVAPGGPIWALAIADCVRDGTESEELTSFSPELRAALDFERSRNPALAAKEREHWLRNARAEDVLQGAVSRAMRAWPP